tara:strand:+ start:229 stop:1605 length:1377 start_codon:yes stop_codon:yes gene_type:complete
MSKIKDLVAKSLLKLGNRLTPVATRFSDQMEYDLHPSTDEPMSRTTMDTYLRAYQNVLWVFCGVNTIATSAAMVPLKVCRYTAGGDSEEVDDHPVLELLESPNKLLTQFELLVRTFAFLELTGNSYWFLEHPNGEIDSELFGNGPIKIHVERPDLVEPQLRATGEKIDYNRQVNDKTVSVDMEDVLHFTHFNPLSTYSGLPTLAAGQDSIVLEVYLSTFGKNFYQNAVVPSMVFGTDQELSDAAFERFKVLIERQYKGIDKAHQLLLLGGGLQPMSVKTPSPADSDYNISNEMIRDKTLMNMGCYHLVNIAGGKPGDAVRQSYRMFWQETMKPRLHNVQQLLTKDLLRLYPNSSDLYFEFDTRAVSGLREDFMDESLGYFRFIQAGVMTRNEVRNKIGIPGDIVDGDKTGLGYEPSSSRFVSNDERADVEGNNNYNGKNMKTELAYMREYMERNGDRS